MIFFGSIVFNQATVSKDYPRFAIFYSESVLFEQNGRKVRNHETSFDTVN